jgi:hypothetical protein
VDKTDIAKIDIEDFETKEDTLSLYKAVKEDVNDKIEVEIGDSKDPTTFQPQAKIMRWDNEVNLSVRYKDDSKVETVVETKEDVVEWVKPDREVHIYEKPEIAEDGGLEIEVVLKEKPISNVIEFSIETKGLEFFYQPELEDSEVEGMVERERISMEEAKRRCRPENVVGSYAVYYKDTPANYVGGKEYKAGKMCHIYRPKVADAKGNEIWGELNVDVDNNLLTVTVDEEWLERAIYPVIVDPTFGYTTAGSSSAVVYSASIYPWYGSLFTSTEAGSATSLSVYIKSASTGFRYNVKGTIVLHSDLTIIANGVGGGASYNSTAQWITSSFSTSPSLTTSTDYVLSVVWENTHFASMCYTHMYYDEGDENQGHFETDNNYSSPTDPSGITHDSNKYSIYATYTASASGPTGVKTINGTAIASVKTVNGTAIASVKTING